MSTGRQVHCLQLHMPSENGVGTKKCFVSTESSSSKPDFKRAKRRLKKSLHSACILVDSSLFGSKSVVIVCFTRNRLNLQNLHSA